MAFSLEQNFPNPFNPATTIRFTLPRALDVSLTIMNILGEEVATLASRQMEQGTHTLRWDASGIPSGMYLYRLKARQRRGPDLHRNTETPPAEITFPALFMAGCR